MDSLGAAGGSQFVEGARAVCLDGVFRNEKLRGDLAIAVAAGDQGKDFEVKATAPKDPILGSGVGGGLRKDDTALREKLNAAIAAVRADGTYDKIAKKYFDFNVYGS